MARILIVDDEPSMRLSLQRLIPHLGHEVAGTAKDGMEAFTATKLLMPDLVLMDIVMPGEMDGIDAAKKIRAELDIPVIFITGYSDEAFLNRAKCADPFGYLVKPCSEEDLKAAIEMALDKKERERRLQESITSLRQTKEALRQSEERYRLLVENTKDLIARISPAGTLLFASEAARSLFGYDPEDVIGLATINLVHADDRQLALRTLKTVTETGQTETAEFRLLCQNGHYKWVEAAGKRQSDDQPGGGDIIMVVRDITERRQMEEERLVMGKLESTGLLAGGIAHDFNNLLAAIVGNIELARSVIPYKDEAADYLAIAEQAAWNAQGLTQQLITFSKGGEPARKVFPLSRLLEEHTTFTLKGSPIRSSFILPADLWHVEGDEGQIGQVIRNLVLNAREAMAEGGMLTVQAENIVLRSPSPFSLPDGDYVNVNITDQGGGIGEDILPKVFDPYFSTKRRGIIKGMGLGLTICHAIVKKHGGALTVATEENVGTTFHIYLPASEKPLPEPGPALRDPQTGKGRILVMDDEEMMRNLTGKALQQSGYEVTLAVSGEEAVQLYGKAQELEQPFDIVILDLTVPGGMGGIKTLQAIQVSDPGVKAVVMSGYGDDAVIMNYEAYGFRGALTKPYRLFELRELIARVNKANAVAANPPLAQDNAGGNEKSPLGSP